MEIRGSKSALNRGPSDVASVAKRLGGVATRTLSSGGGMHAGGGRLRSRVERSIEFATLAIAASTTCR